MWTTLSITRAIVAKTIHTILMTGAFQRLNGVTNLKKLGCEASSCRHVRNPNFHFSPLHLFYLFIIGEELIPLLRSGASDVECGDVSI